MFDKSYHIHLIGIGGIGMSSIAEILIAQGYTVTGSDISVNDNIKRLKKLGGTIYTGHSKQNIKDASVVVFSSAVKPDNPEIIAAKSENIPVIPRAEMLAELMRLKYGVAVAGAHGKTTTTSLISEILIEGGFDPTIIIGGMLKRLGTNARLGAGSFLAAEADESDGSFLKMTPSYSIVTNIDKEHLDFYKDIDEIKSSFLEFLNKIPFYGLSAICLDNQYIQEILPDINKRFVTYGIKKQADYRAKDIVFSGLQSKFTVLHEDEKLGEVELSLPGKHNVLNALGAIALGFELGISFEVITNSLKKIQGVKRRMEIKGQSEEMVVMDDYGHHPTEIQTTLNAVKKAYPDKKTIILFQPHRYTRTKSLFNEFTASFYESDILVILPIYPAGEKPIEGVDNFHLAKAIKEHGHKNVLAVEDKDQAMDYLKELKGKNLLLLTLGAGDVWKVGEQFIRDEF